MTVEKPARIEMQKPARSKGAGDKSCGNPYEVKLILIEVFLHTYSVRVSAS